jgi:hypothetical protein
MQNQKILSLLDSKQIGIRSCNNRTVQIYGMIADSRKSAACMGTLGGNIIAADMGINFDRAVLTQPILYSQ